MKALLINDTRVGNHFGCEIVVQSIISELKARDFSKLHTVPSLTRTEDILRVSEKFEPDVVIVNAEGTFHGNHFGIGLLSKAIQLLRDRQIPVVLINGTFENLSSDTIKALASANKIYCRDSNSVQYLTSLGLSCEYCPDLVILSEQHIIAHRSLTSEELILFTDTVLGRDLSADFSKNLRKSMYLLSATIILPSRIFSIRQLIGVIKRNFLRYLVKFHYALNTKAAIALHKNSKLVLAGRYHSVCLCIRLGIPVIAVNSNTKKIQNLLTDIGLESRCVNNFSQVNFNHSYSYSKQELNRINEFKQRGRQLKNNMFKWIKDVAEKQ